MAAITLGNFASHPALGRDPAAARRRIDGLERVLERAFIIPGLNRGIGLDAVLGIVPVAGDIVAAAIGLYLVWEARNLGAGRLMLARMIGNVAIDAAIGAVPGVGDVFDLLFRSNSRNVRLVRRYLDRQPAPVRNTASRAPSW